MLVDADKAKEKLAKVLSDLGAHFTVIDTIRQADLTDCMVESDYDIDKAYQMLSLFGVPKERARSVSNGIDVLMTRMNRQVESLSAQVAELKKALEMIYDKWENGDPCYEYPDESAGFLGNAVNLTEEEEHLVLRLIPAIDAAKEGK